MSKVIEPPRPPNRAFAIARKLEAATGALRALAGEVGQAALEAFSDAPGAAKRLGDLRLKIRTAECEVDELTKAHALAARLDQQSDVAAAAKMREEQFRVFKVHADARLKALQTVLEAISIAVPAYAAYASETHAMVGALPSGVRLGIVNLGHNGSLGSWLGDLSHLLAAESFRLSAPGTARLPFARPPEMSTDIATIEPGIEIMTAAQRHVLRDLEGQLENLDREQEVVA
jgi:hypothetical protein